MVTRSAQRPQPDEPQPRISGVGSEWTRRGLAVYAGGARFTFGADDVTIVWSTTWTGPDRETVARSQIADIVVASDQRAVAGHPTWKMQVKLADGRTLVPMRRRPLPQVHWVVGRLRRELGMPALEPLADAQQEPDEDDEPPLWPAPPPDVPLKPKPLPKPVASVEVVRRPGRLIVRVGAVSARRVEPAAWGFFCAVATIGGIIAVGAVLAWTRPVERDPAAAAVVTVLALAMAGLAGWVVWRIALEASRRHAIHLSPAALRVGSTRRPRRPGNRRRSIPRAHIAGFGSGPGDWPNVAAHHLFVYLRDGHRVSVLEGRSPDELAWVAHVLSCALEQVPAAPHPATPNARAEVAPEPAAVLPYEARGDDPHRVQVRRFADGAVTVTIPPRPSDQVAGAVPLLLLLAGGIVLELILVLRSIPPDDRLANALGIVLVALSCGGVAWLIVRYCRRCGQPVVVAVDATHVYVNRPTALDSRRKWERAEVSGVRENTTGRANSAPANCVELALKQWPPERIAQGRGDWDRRRILEALREALGRGGGSSASGAGD